MESRQLERNKPATIGRRGLNSFRGEDAIRAMLWITGGRRQKFQKFSRCFDPVLHEFFRPDASKALAPGLSGAAPSLKILLTHQLIVTNCLVCAPSSRF